MLIMSEKEETYKIKKNCGTCEFCMFGNGHIICAGGYNKEDGKEPYYGQRVYDDETEAYFDSLNENDEVDVSKIHELSDKFKDGCPCWGISFDAYSDMNEEDSELLDELEWDVDEYNKEKYKKLN